MVEIETGTDLGTVYVNPAHVTHVSKNLSGTTDEFSLVWFVSGKHVSVDGSVATVAAMLGKVTWDGMA